MHVIPDSDGPHAIVAKVMDAVPSGLVPLEEWRPEPDTVDEGQSAMYGAVGRKP